VYSGVATPKLNVKVTRRDEFRPQNSRHVYRPPPPSSPRRHMTSASTAAARGKARRARYCTFVRYTDRQVATVRQRDTQTRTVLGGNQRGLGGCRSASSSSSSPGRQINQRGSREAAAPRLQVTTTQRRQKIKRFAARSSVGRPPARPSVLPYWRGLNQ